MNIATSFLEKMPLKWINVALAVVLCAAFAKPLVSDLAAERMPTAMSNNATAASGFYDFGGFFSMLGGMLSSFMDSLNPVVESSVAGIEKQDAAEEQLAQAGLNYEAASESSKAGMDAMDSVSSETSDACEVKRSTLEAAQAKEGEGLIARSLTGAHAQRGLYTQSSSGAMRELLGSSMDEYCSPDSLARGSCKNGVSPKGMPDADIHAGTILSTETGSETMSKDEYEAASKYVSWSTDPVPTENLPIAMEKSPAGQRYLLEKRRRQAITGASQYSMNRIIASRWEKK